jgi:hypothetical protein
MPMACDPFVEERLFVHSGRDGNAAITEGRCG